MSRTGFMGNLALLAAAIGLGWMVLPPMFRPRLGAASPSADPRSAGRPSITPPNGSVKRRG
jgi:hypothetical protein